MPASLVLSRLLRVFCLLVLVLGQFGHAPERLVVPHSHGLLIGDTGANVPVVQGRASQVAARIEVGEAPSERPDLPILPDLLLPPWQRPAPAAQPLAIATQPDCGRKKGFWACGPPVQFG